MKKLTLSLIVLVSFLLGNASMVASIVKLFGTDALLPVVKDLVGRKVDAILWGEPQRPSTIGAIKYDQLRTGGPILKPAAGFPRQRGEGYGYGSR